MQLKLPPVVRAVCIFQFALFLYNSALWILVLPDGDDADGASKRLLYITTLIGPNLLMATLWILVGLDLKKVNRTRRWVLGLLWLPSSLCLVWNAYAGYFSARDFKYALAGTGFPTELALTAWPLIALASVVLSVWVIAESRII